MLPPRPGIIKDDIKYLDREKCIPLHSKKGKIRETPPSPFSTTNKYFSSRIILERQPFKQTNKIYCDPERKDLYAWKKVPHKKLHGEAVFSLYSYDITASL